MPIKDEYCNYILEQLSDFGDINAKRLFGGYGIYKDKLIFAIIVDGELYFKVGDDNRGDYLACNSSPFEVTMKGKKTAMPYWLVPADIIEERTELLAWAEKAYQVASLKKS